MSYVIYIQYAMAYYVVNAIYFDTKYSISSHDLNLMILKQLSHQ